MKLAVFIYSIFMILLYDLPVLMFYFKGTV
jgi:hypothetical protein